MSTSDRPSSSSTSGRNGHHAAPPPPGTGQSRVILNDYGGDIFSRQKLMFTGLYTILSVEVEVEHTIMFINTHTLNSVYHLAPPSINNESWSQMEKELCHALLGMTSWYIYIYK